MSKWLIALLLLATSAFAGGEVQLSDTIIDVSNFGWYGTYSNMAMTANGDVWAFYHIPEASGRYVEAVVFPRFRGDYIRYTHVITGSIGRDQAVEAHGFGDTVLVAADGEADGGDAWLVVCPDSTYEVDTSFLAANFGTWDGRPAAVLMNNGKILTHNVKDEGTTDSTIVGLTDGWPVTGQATIKQVNTTKAGLGWRTTLYYNGDPWGVLSFEDGIANDLWVTDTLGIHVDLEPSFLPGNVFEATQFVMVDDSVGCAVTQTGTSSGTDSIIAFTFKIRGTGTASPTYADGTVTTFATAAEVPDGVICYPCISHKMGTDTLVATYVYFNNVANSDSGSLVRRVSGDKGETWSSATVVKPAIDGWNMTRLKTTPELYADQEGGLYSVIGYTPSATVDTFVYFWFDTLVTPAAASSRRVILIQ